MYLTRSKKYVKRKVITPLLGWLTMGLSPRKLAATVALGLVVGIMPVFGLTTLVATALGFRFRLNIPALLLISYLAGPFHLLFYLPFIHLGIFIFGADEFRLSFEEILNLFREDWLLAIRKIWMAHMLGLVAWLLLSGPLGFGIYALAKPVFQKMAHRRRQKEALAVRD